MVEQWTHKPLDVGSNPTLATSLIWGSSTSYTQYMVVYGWLIKEKS